MILSKATRSIAATAARNVSVRYATTFSAPAPASFKFYGALAASTTAIVAYQYENNKSSSTIIAHCDALPVYGVPGTNLERTFLAVKPDGVQRALIGDIIARFEKRGYKLVGLKMVWPTLEMAQTHYQDLSKKPFYPGLCAFFSSGPIVCMCWEGKDIIKQGRQMLGETQPLVSSLRYSIIKSRTAFRRFFSCDWNPAVDVIIAIDDIMSSPNMYIFLQASKPGSIRGDYSIDLGRNICHGSDSPEAAEHELKMWFPEGVNDWKKSVDSSVYEG